MHGKLANDAQLFPVKKEGVEIPMVSFSLLDYGMPNQKNDPLIIEVHFMKDVAARIQPSLVKGKEVIVDGFLAKKDYITRSGEAKSKFYISASIVEFVGSAEREEGMAA